MNLLAYDVSSGTLWVLIPSLIGLLALARIGWWMLARYRRQMLGEGMSEGAWTLDDLERMRDAGQISDQEFKILRDLVMRTFSVPGRSKKTGK